MTADPLDQVLREAQQVIIVRDGGIVSVGPGANIFGGYRTQIGSVAIEQVRALDPAFADALARAAEISEIHDRVSDLASEVAKLTHARAQEKPGLLGRIADKVTQINAIASGVAGAAETGHHLYNAAAALLTAHGVPLPPL